MLCRLPRHLPPLSLMLADIGSPSPSAVARALGVSARSVRRWVAVDDAPRPVLAALFWLTRWGVSAVDAEAHNAAVLAASYVRALKDENGALRADLGRALALADGAANVSSWRELPLAQVLPFRPRERRPTVA
jgi:hypothetical protein